MTDKAKEYLDKLDEYIELEHSDSVNKYFDMLNNQYHMRKSQLKRAYDKYNHVFSEIVEKIIAKYESDSYKDYWYNKSIEPPTPLYFFLLEYAENFGTEATENEYKEFGNDFTSSMFYYNGYYVSRMDGQGSCVQVWKANNDSNITTFNIDVYKEQLNKINQISQNQGSLTEQLQLLIPFANKLGLYDAADYIKNL